MKQISGLKVVLTLALIAVGLFGMGRLDSTAHAAGITYYISSSVGNDSNSGTSTSAPWKTISKLNQTTFQPGDTILFKKGDVWTGETLYPKGNGNYAAGNWITVSTYSSGNRPVISPGSSQPAAIRFDDTSFTGGWKITGLDIQNAKMGIYAYKNRTSSANGLWLEDLNFTNITGNNIGASTNPGFYDAVFCSQSITVHSVNHVTIKNVTSSYSDMGMLLDWGDDITVDNVRLDHHYRYGVWMANLTNSVMKNSKVLYSGFRDGMTWGTAGIQFNNNANTNIEDTEVAYTQAPNKSPDGVAIDFESDNVNCQALRVNVHDNQGSAFLIMENPDWGTLGKQTGTHIKDGTFANNGLRGVAGFIRYYNNSGNTSTVSGNTILKASSSQMLNDIGGVDSWPSGWTASNNTIGTVIPASGFSSLIDDSSGSITYSGSWWSGTVAGFFKDSAHSTSTPGSYAEYTFNGTGISWVSSVNSNLGRADVTIDGVFAGSVEQYSTSGQAIVTLFQKTGLANGTHTIRVTLRGDKSPQSGMASMDVDAFVVLQPNVTGAIDDSASGITFAGSWWGGSASGYYNQTAHASSTAGNYAEVSFTGTGISWIGAMNSAHGRADVYLDGNLVNTVDTYARDGILQVRLYSATGLSYGSHTLKIVVRGDKLPASSNVTIDVDAFVVS
ncbi:right-handed parallel beta-helix repeat-containing protein [Cohnella soli]|uniref:Right-handed parallel beta-helix repeat-containing protein n=1 Tax=Cohnella soli TaxID=425005 RepID=A0ABW0HWS3_9BACL